MRLGIARGTFRLSTNGKYLHLLMSMLKAVMVDLRAWNNCLVALNMCVGVGTRYGNTAVIY